MLITKKETAYAHVRRLLQTGKLLPGDRLTEIPLARDANVSRTPMREAIRQLTSEGVVELTPGLGAVVKMPTSKEIIELYEIRETLESLAASKAALCIGQHDLKRLQELCDQMCEILTECGSENQWGEEQRQALIEKDLEFHAIIQGAAGNQSLSNLLSDYRLLMQVFGYSIDPQAIETGAERQKWILKQHQALLDALHRRDSKAAATAMADHIRTAKEKMLVICTGSGTNE